MSDEHLDLVMPFVTVTSKGGPHDDASYGAGWEMGALDLRLQVAAALSLPLPQATVQRINLPQLDLIAMKNGTRMIVVDWDDLPQDLDDRTREVWAFVAFEYAVGAAGE